MRAPYQPPIRVLTIDAADDLRLLYRELLVPEGYDVTSLACGQATRAAIAAARPDVVILDCFLGCDRTGWQVLEALEQAEGRVPVVVCTTDMDLVDGSARLPEEVVGVLPKPFDIQALLSALAVASHSPSPAGAASRAGRALPSTNDDDPLADGRR